MEDERKGGEERRPADDGPHALNIAAAIFQDLRRQILAGQLAPGERLPGERELATKYGTNRNTLREAVRRLEQSRLVTVRHGQGVTVADFRRSGTLELLSPFLETAPEPGEVAQILEDLLPARLRVIEFAARLAIRRADPRDMERLQDLTDLLISAFEGRDTKVIAHGFHRWLDALIDAGHSVAVRWIANPFLEAYRDLLDRFPFLWVLDPGFPVHLRGFMTALTAADEERAIAVTRTYYESIDGPLMRMIDATLAARKAVTPAPPGGPPSELRLTEPPEPLDDEAHRTEPPDDPADDPHRTLPPEAMGPGNKGPRFAVVTNGATRAGADPDAPGTVPPEAEEE